jgi:lysophospholipase L1-like esterase
MSRNILFNFSLILLFLNAACVQTEKVTYLALGDSYTIGESVDSSQRWPVQLAEELRTSGYEVADPKIIARTGWTTDELQNAINEEKPNSNYDLVSILIGVNNQYRGYPIDQYIKEFEELLIKAISFAGNDSEKVFVVSIPNYGVTPFGIEKGENKIRQELLIYDAIADSISSIYNVPFVNITPVSEKAKADGSYIADDELHPSGKQYSEWVELIIPVAKAILKDPSSKK